MEIRSLNYQSSISETALLASYAGTDIERWTIFKKYPFFHKSFGIGFIKSIEKKILKIYISKSFSMLPLKEKPRDILKIKHLNKGTLYSQSQ